MTIVYILSSFSVFQKTPKKHGQIEKLVFQCFSVFFSSFSVVFQSVFQWQVSVFQFFTHYMCEKLKN